MSDDTDELRARIATLEAQLAEQFDLLSDFDGWARQVCRFLTDVQQDDRCYHIARSQAGYWRDRCPGRPADEATDER